jgi:putative DNA primase/helicase
VIAADNDYSYTGQAAAYALAKRLKLAGKIVEVIMPEIIGEDFNDEIKRKNRP